MTFPTHPTHRFAFFLFDPVAPPSFNLMKKGGEEGDRKFAEPCDGATGLPLAERHPNVSLAVDRPDKTKSLATRKALLDHEEPTDARPAVRPWPSGRSGGRRARDGPRRGRPSRRAFHDRRSGQ